MLVKKKRELFPGVLPASPGSFVSPHDGIVSTPRLGNMNPIPFRRSGVLRGVRRGVTCATPPRAPVVARHACAHRATATPAYAKPLRPSLGPTNSRRTSLPAKPFSSSAFKQLHFAKTSRLNICYCHQDLHRWRLQAGSRRALRRAPPRPPTRARLPLPRAAVCRQAPERPLRTRPFSGLLNSAGELLHTP